MTDGTVMHWQMLSRDPARTARFYSSLFGWRVSDANGMGYRTVDTGGSVNGGLWPVPPEAPEAVQLYIQVADIDGALARLVELGGTVVMPRQILPDGDAMALALDPLGRSFGLMTPRA
jgi:predicted enzyme related to lactoylglutathione lyase